MYSAPSWYRVLNVNSSDDILKRNHAKNADELFDDNYEISPAKMHESLSTFVTQTKQTLELCLDLELLASLERCYDIVQNHGDAQERGRKLIKPLCKNLRQLFPEMPVSTRSSYYTKPHRGELLRRAFSIPIYKFPDGKCIDYFAFVSVVCDAALKELNKNPKKYERELENRNDCTNLKAVCDSCSWLLKHVFKDTQQYDNILTLIQIKNLDNRYY